MIPSACEDPIGRLVHDFGCVRSADMYNDLLKQQVHYFKETEGGKEEMCEIIENVAEKIERMMNIMKNVKAVQSFGTYGFSRRTLFNRRG